MLLMGQDAVHFNRQLARSGLSAVLPRLSPVGEENTLLAGGVGAVCGSVDVATVVAMPSGHFYSSPRGLMRLDSNLLDQDVYVAAADGMEFLIEQQIARAH